MALTPTLLLAGIEKTVNALLARDPASPSRLRSLAGQRVLMCLDDNLAGALFEQPRYQPFQLGDLPALVVSSLEEMLAEPVRHKRDSWRAMVTEGFDGRG